MLWWAQTSASISRAALWNVNWWQQMLRFNLLKSIFKSEDKYWLEQSKMRDTTYKSNLKGWVHLFYLVCFQWGEVKTQAKAIGLHCLLALWMSFSGTPELSRTVVDSDFSRYLTSNVSKNITTWSQLGKQGDPWIFLKKQCGKQRGLYVCLCAYTTQQIILTHYYENAPRNVSKALCNNTKFQ